MIEPPKSQSQEKIKYFSFLGRNHQGEVKKQILPKQGNLLQNMQDSRDRKIIKGVSPFLSFVKLMQGITIGKEG